MYAHLGESQLLRLCPEFAKNDRSAVVRSHRFGSLSGRSCGLAQVMEFVAKGPPVAREFSFHGCLGPSARQVCSTERVCNLIRVLRAVAHGRPPKHCRAANPPSIFCEYWSTTAGGCDAHVRYRAAD